MDKDLNPTPTPNQHKITELRQSLADSVGETYNAEEKFRLLVESVKDYAIFLLDPNGFIESWNLGAENIKGYSASEIIGSHFSIFYTPEDRARSHPQDELVIARKVGRYEEEGWRIRKNGTRFWANVVITALRDNSGNLVGFAKVTRDLSDKRQIEEKLRFNEERNRLMFEGVKDYGMFMLNPEGFVQTWNEGARRIKGYEASEIIGKHFSTFYCEEDVKMGKCDFELREAAMVGRFEDEGWRFRKDGTRFWANVVITAMRDKTNKLIGFSKVTRDMTERRQYEEKLKLAVDHLERRVEERTRELKEINRKLIDAVQLRDEFLSIASHELRTPLTPLKLQLQVLLKHVKQNTFGALSEERQMRMAASCERAVSRLGSLIDNLLDVSRINSGKLTLNPEKTDYVELLKEVVERHRAEITNVGSLVTFDMPEKLEIQCDRLRIEQVITNLLSNAIRYGGGKPLELSLKAEGTNALFCLRDHGNGIAEDDQRRIFERFERANAVAGGLGLGLYIAKQIVETHRGTISLESKLGEGSAFHIKLPLHQ